MYISPSCVSKTMVLCYIYIDHLSQLLRNQNSLTLFLIENSVISPILSISKLNALNILKVITYTSWGADTTTHIKLYRSLVGSKLDYGCILYGSARKSCLQLLGIIHNQGLILA